MLALQTPEVTLGGAIGRVAPEVASSVGASEGGVMVA